MKLKFQKAIYGEVKNAHKLIEKEGDDNTIFDDIYRFTDLPISLPKGLNWEPYYTGLPFREYYLIMKTFPDFSANRTGMVLTYVLLFNLNEFSQINDLSPIFDLLPEEIIKEIKSIPSEIEISVTEKPIISNPKIFLNAVRELLNSSSDALPVIWWGQNNFKELISLLWSNFSPSVRKTFSFGMSFIPEDLTNRQFTIVSSGTSKESKWINKKVAKEYNGESEPPSSLESYLLGTSEESHLASIISQLNIKGDTLKQLQLASKSEPYISKIENNEEISFIEIIALIKLLEVISPENAFGKVLKDKVIEKLSESITTANLDDIKKLRKLEPKGFQDQKRKLLKAIVNWFHKKIGNYKLLRENEITLLFEILNEKTGILFESTQAFLDTKKTDYPFISTLVWEFWLRHPENIKILEKWIENSKESEESFCKKCPGNVPEDLGEILSTWAMSKDWQLFNFSVTVSSLPLKNALQKLATSRKNKIKPEWFNSLNNRLSTKAVVKAISELDDAKLIKIAVDLSEKESQILDTLDMSYPNSQTIWLEMFKKSGNLWAGIGDLGGMVFKILDLLVAGINIEPRLILELSQSDFADLTFYPNRKQIWELLDFNINENFLSATAVGWLSYFISKEWDGETIESELEKKVTDYSFFRKFLTKHIDKSPAIITKFYNQFPFLSEYRFDKDLILVQENIRKINILDASSIGELINGRGWSSCANRLASDVYWYNRNDMNPAVNKCLGLLNIINQGRGYLLGYDVKPLSKDDWWKLFEENIVELYPEGPQDQEIWSRANGKKAILDYNGNGEQRWHKALRDLRNGGGGKHISPLGLLSLVIDNYDKKELKLLFDLGRKLNIN